jgi:uncharacterized protein with PIN domain
MQRKTDEKLNAKCPACNAELKETRAERAINRLGQRKSDHPVETGVRHEYHCGAVVLTNKDYPDGTMEASCCLSSNRVK